MLALVLGKCQNSNMKNTQYEKKLLKLVKKLHKNLGEAVALVDDASSLLDYEDDKKPTYGIKYRCEKFMRKIRQEWQ
jgi:hypothetical protein